jgi:hypothetical protein
MATPSQLIPSREPTTVVRLAEPELTQLLNLMFRRYPEFEWATFARFGWRKAGDKLVLSLAALDPPGSGDLDESVGHVAIAEPWTLRTALNSEEHLLAVGVIHSHPEQCAPHPSRIDDDMDGYYSEYFASFAPGRPYVSLIIARVDGELALSGRVFFQNKWRVVDHFAVERQMNQTWPGGRRPVVSDGGRERTKRLADAFGKEAAARLGRSTVAVIGAGGTGSAVIETLARAGVGQLILVDPDHLDESNLERVHGSRPEHAAKRIPKVLLAREHVNSIDPNCEVRCLAGALPQSDIVDAVVSADIAIGCTDNQHSRLALSDLALRYLVPAIDCGVMLEGRAGKVTGQIMQFVRFLPADPCALCRQMIVPSRLAQELMSEDERARRRAAAAAALAQGREGGAYWSEQPQLNTVGYLTTATGALAAGYAIGWLTGRFDTPYSRLQMNIIAPFFDVTDSIEDARADCACRQFRGWADQASANSLITAPAHWPPVQRL